MSDNVDQDKMAVLEARIRAIEGVDLYDPVKAVEMCLVPNVVVPKKFRIPDFIKYTGTQCPVTHLKSYCNKMAEVVHDEKLLMHFFQDSLNGPALNWYMRLDNTRIHSGKTWWMPLLNNTSTTWILPLIGLAYQAWRRPKRKT